MFFFKNYITQYTVHLKVGWTALHVPIVNKEATAKQLVIKTYKDNSKAIQQNIRNEEGGRTQEK